jgi:hypothetical protein
MVVEAGQQFNFAYVLPGEGPVQLAVDAALSMGWCNSPSFFCTATKSGCILAYHILDSNTQLLPHSWWWKRASSSILLMSYGKWSSAIPPFNEAFLDCSTTLQQWCFNFSLTVPLVSGILPARNWLGMHTSCIQFPSTHLCRHFLHAMCQHPWGIWSGTVFCDVCCVH